jgi:hypothetical protein
MYLNNTKKPESFPHSPKVMTADLTKYTMLFNEDQKSTNLFLGKECKRSVGIRIPLGNSMLEVKMGLL